MSNDVIVYLTFRTPKAREILRAISPPPFTEVDLYTLIPKPENTGGLSWHEWGKLNLGTECVDRTNYIIISDDHLHISFVTRWAPPTKWLKRLFQTFKIQPEEVEEAAYWDEGDDCMSLLSPTTLRVMDCWIDDHRCEPGSLRIIPGRTSISTARRLRTNVYDFRQGSAK
jgi:hypothetical protein